MKRNSNYLKKISITYLNQKGLLYSVSSTAIRWENAFDKNLGSVTIAVQPLFDKPFVQLSYIYGEEHIKYKVHLTTTPCTFGGVRYWFICPFEHCWRRVGTLYQGSKYFGCRHCLNLTYTARLQSRGMRALSRQLDAYKKIKKLEEEIKVREYNGFPTRKQLRLRKLYTIIGVSRM